MSEKDLEDQYESDLRDLVSTYRSLKNLGVWAAGLFAFILVILSIILAAKQIGH